MLKHIFSIGAVVMVVYLMMIFSLTSPDQVSPLILLSVFLAIFVLLWRLVFGLINIIKRTQELVYKDLVLKTKLLFSDQRNNYLYSAVVAGSLVVLLAMQSISPLKFYEFALVVLINVLIIFYIHKKT